MSFSRYGTRVDYIFCGWEVRNDWKAVRAWHSPKKINESHYPVFVLFNQRPPSQTLVAQERTLGIVDPKTRKEIPVGGASADKKVAITPAISCPVNSESSSVEEKNLMEGDAILCSEDELTAHIEQKTN